MMGNKLKLTTIKLETKEGKAIEVSLAEAQDLYGQLHELFGSKYMPSIPIVTERDRYLAPPIPHWPPEPYWGTTWCSTGQTSGPNAAVSIPQFSTRN